MMEILNYSDAAHKVLPQWGACQILMQSLQLMGPVLMQLAELGILDPRNEGVYTVEYSINVLIPIT